MNYKDHAAELGLSPPDVPEVFFKPSTCLHSPVAPVCIPRAVCEEIDGEVELAIVISKECKNVSTHEAMEYVLGYTLANDITSRRVQKASSQWSYCKGFDGFCPLGPCLVSPKLIPDPSSLSLKTTLNDTVLQNGSTSNLIFSVPEIISHLSFVRSSVPSLTQTE